jgi:hypothetical protein
MTHDRRAAIVLEALCRETGEEFDNALSKAEASKRREPPRAVSSIVPGLKRQPGACLAEAQAGAFSDS